MSGECPHYLPSYVFRSRYDADHLSVDAARTLCGKAITWQWLQVPAVIWLCNRCRPIAKRLEEEAKNCDCEY